MQIYSLQQLTLPVLYCTAGNNDRLTVQVNVCKVKVETNWESTAKQLLFLTISLLEADCR